MGYTHYWTFKPAARGEASQVEAAYQTAVRDCQRIILAYQKENGGLSGYSAHTKLGQYGGIKLNGKGDDGHEDFFLREHFSQNLDQVYGLGGGGFNFCKTAQKPYDVVVVACLCVLAYRLGDNVKVSSDGSVSDWAEGLELARRVLKRKIKMPFSKNEAA